MNRIVKKVNWGEALVPGLTVVFILAFFVDSGDAPKGALVWPLITAAVTIGFLAAVAARFVFSARGGDLRFNPAWLWREGRPVGIITLGVLAYLVAIPYLGFSLCNLFFMLTVFRGLGGRNWLKNLTVALGISVFLHLALVEFMQLSLPRLELGGVTI